MPRTATFYTHVADKDQFTCRLVRTVYDAGTRLLILCGDENEPARLSKALWTHEDNSFLAHEIHRTDTPFPAYAPVVLAQSLPDCNDFVTVLNLSENLCIAPQIKRVLEIIGTEPSELAAARIRFAAYRQAGFTLEHHRR